MITSVKIERFRGAREGSVTGLSGLSILVGPNNSGKSTALEAIAMVGLSLRDVGRMLLRRGGPPLDALRKALAYGEVSPTRITADSDAGQFTRTISLPGVRGAEALAIAERERFSEPWFEIDGSLRGPRGPHDGTVLVAASGQISHETVSEFTSTALISTNLIDVETVRGEGALEDAYSDIDKAGRLPDVIAALRPSMTGLTDLKILKVVSSFILHTYCEGKPPIPAYVAGDGLKRFLQIAAAIVEGGKELALLEEPESFQHPRYLRELARLLLGAAATRQIVLTTHSIELIDLLIEGASETFPTVHRLRLIEGTLRSTTLSPLQAREARADLLEDLRS